MSATRISPLHTGSNFFKSPRVFAKRGVNGFPIGPRTEKRQAMNRELNKLPDSVKKVCELRIANVCVKNIMLTWAHSKKSRFLTTDKDWKEAARACQPCHAVIEALSHSGMKHVIREAIAKRKL